MYQGHPKIQEWREQREIVTGCLYSLVDQLDKFHLGVNKAGIAGSSVGVGGSVIGLTCAAVAPFCGGVSLVPGIAIASGSSIVGTATSVVGHFAGKRKKKKVFKDVESLLKEDEDCTKEVQEIARRLDEAEVILQRYLTELVMSSLEDSGQRDDSQNSQPVSSYPAQAGAPVPYNSPVPSDGSNPDIDVKQMLALFNKGRRMFNSVSLMKTGSRQVLQIGKTFIKDGAQSGKQALKAVKMGKAAKVGGIVVTVVLLPIEIAELITRVKDWKSGKGHPSSDEIKDQAKKLQDGIALVEKELYGKITTINNLVLLIQYLKKRGCSERLNSLLNQILKKLLPIKDLIKAFDKVEPTDRVTSSPGEEQGLFGMLVNYTEVNINIFKELAVMLWTAWRMGSKSFVFLQNTGFTAAPALWTLFGESLNSFGIHSKAGVTTLLPFDFQGDIISEHEFHGDHADWHGRCLIVNVSVDDMGYSLVNLLAPEDRPDRYLFLQEATAFIRKYAYGRSIIASNFPQEIHTMTVEANKRQVCPNTPWSLMEKFLPYPEVAEYLLYYHSHEADVPNTKVYEVCGDFISEDPQMIFVDWKRCKAILSNEICKTQSDWVEKLGLHGLWHEKNRGIVGFSTERTIDWNHIFCSKSVEFFIAPELEMMVKSCSLDHDLRFLGFLKEAILQFAAK